MKLNEKIMTCRRRMTLSQEGLAELVGVSRQAVSKWECGDAIPEPAKILLLARTFGVSTDWLLDDELDDQPTAQTLDADPEPQANPHAQTLDSPPPANSTPEWLDRAPSTVGRFLRKWGWLAGVYIMVVGLLIVGVGGAGRLLLGVFTQAVTNEMVTIYPDAAFPPMSAPESITVFDQNGQVWEDPPQEVLDAIGDVAGPSVTITPQSPDVAIRVEPASILMIVPNLIITIGVAIMLVGLAVAIALRKMGRGDRT